MQQSWGQLGSSQRARPTGSRQVPFKGSGAADPIRPLLSRGALLRAHFCVGRRKVPPRRRRKALPRRRKVPPRRRICSVLLWLLARLG